MKQKRKNKYDPKIKTVKYLVIFYQKNQTKSWPVFNTASKVYIFPVLVSGYSIFNAILLKLNTQTVQTLNCCYL